MIRYIELVSEVLSLGGMIRLRITLCDNCNKELSREKENVDFYYPTFFTITETPGNSPYQHNVTFLGEKQPNYTKHFCSEKCIGEYYNKQCECGTHEKGEHCHNISSLNLD